MEVIVNTEKPKERKEKAHIGKEEVKQCMFADDIIVHKEYTKNQQNYTRTNKQLQQLPDAS